MTDIASLSLEIDSTSAVKARADQDALTESGKKLEKQYEWLTQAQLNANYASWKAAQAFMNQRVAVEAASSEVQKILGRYDPLGAKLRQLQSDFSNLDKAITAGAVGGTSDAALDKSMRAINMEIAKTKELMVAAGAGTEVAGTSMTKLGLNTQMARMQLTTLGAAALRGDFAMMPRTFLSLVARSNLLALALNPVVLSVVGLTAAAAGLAAAFVVGGREARSMNNALTVTGNIAGLTRQSMLDLSGVMSDVSTLTVRASKEIVTSLVASGQIGASSISSVAKLASDFAAATGRDVERITPELVRLFADPAKGAEELNRQMNFLGPAQLENIRNLQRQGQLGEAQLQLSKSIADQIPREIVQLGLLETAWDKVKKAVSSALDAALSFGRPETTQGALEAAQTALKRLQTQPGGPLTSRQAESRELEIANAQQRVSQALLALDLERRNVEASQSKAEEIAAVNRATGLARSLSDFAKIRDLQNDIKNIRDNILEGNPRDVDANEAIRRLKQQILDIETARLAKAQGAAELTVTQEQEEAKVLAEAAEAATIFRIKEREQDEIAKQLGMDRTLGIITEEAEIQEQANGRSLEQRKEFFDERMRILIEAYEREQVEAIRAGAEQLAIDASIAKQKKENQLAAFKFAGDLASLVNTNSKKMFEVGKAASLAIAVIKGHESAVSAYAAGSKIGGPVVGAAFAAASILATANLINNIRSQQFGGGAGGTPTSPTQGASNVSLGGAGGASLAPVVPTSQIPSVTVVVQGNIVGNREFVDDELIPAIRDAVDNRDFVLIGPNSRQASNLAQ